MASRPVFIPVYEGPDLVRERLFDFPWAPGFAEVQKKKNVKALHEAAKDHGIERVLEISSKSDEEVGKRLSAFNLQITLGDRRFPLESVYQGSKVFERSGPFPHVFELSPRDAKRFLRERHHENLIAFELEEKRYPLNPKSAFYDWLYIRSVAEAGKWPDGIFEYEAFTDIEFNPAKQVNCQARAFAEYRSLLKRDKLEEATTDFASFAAMLDP